MVVVDMSKCTFTPQAATPEIALKNLTSSTHALTLCLCTIASHSPVLHGCSASIAPIAAIILSAVAENAVVPCLVDGMLTREVMALTQSAHRASAPLGIFAGSRVWH